MDWASGDIVSVIYYLLPGFVAAWVFYGLTAHPKASPFERVVQALIFTVVIQPVTVITGWFLLACGNIISLGTWTANSAFTWSVLLAFAFGLLFAWLANKDYCHALLRHCRITKRTSFPSEWYSAFYQGKRWVVLHLPGGRRLYGWPEEWPDQPDTGHFLIDQPIWLLDNGEYETLPNVEKTLVPAVGVEMVEFVERAVDISTLATEPGPNP